LFKEFSKLFQYFLFYSVNDIPFMSTVYDMHRESKILGNIPIFSPLKAIPNYLQ